MQIIIQGMNMRSWEMISRVVRFTKSYVQGGAIPLIFCLFLTGLHYVGVYQ